MEQKYSRIHKDPQQTQHTSKQHLFAQTTLHTLDTHTGATAETSVWTTGDERVIFLGRPHEERERGTFFFSLDFTQTRNAQASAAAWVNKRTGLTSLSPGPGACARQYSLCCCQRGCWGLKNYTLQLKGCLCWSAKAFLSILQPTACHVLGGRPPS